MESDGKVYYIKSLNLYLNAQTVHQLNTNPKEVINTFHVNQGYDKVCLSDIIEKHEEIPAVFQGALIESGKFEYTDVEGKLQHGNISADLSNDAIAQLNRDFSRRECKLQIIRRIVNYSSGRKKENVELMGIVAKG